MTKIREPPFSSLGINIRSKYPGVMRGTGPGEVRVHIYSRTGAFMQTKIGNVLPDGRCFVRFEEESVEATKEGQKWVYRVPLREMDYDEDY